ncbi:MAG: hypothetical protein SNJ74_01835 [Fimbriimonadaceae bacterium]
MLFKSRLLNTEEFHDLLAVDRGELDPVPSVVLRLGYATETEICFALAKASKLRVRRISGFTPPADVLGLLPDIWAVKHRVVPIRCLDDTIEVVTDEPLPPNLIDELSILTWHRPVVRLVPASEMSSLLSRTYMLDRKWGGI